MKFSAALVDILTKTKPKTERYDRIKFVRGKIIRNKIPAESERERVEESESESKSGRETASLTASLTVAPTV